MELDALLDLVRAEVQLPPMRAPKTVQKLTPAQRAAFESRDEGAVEEIVFKAAIFDLKQERCAVTNCDRIGTEMNMSSQKPSHADVIVLLGEQNRRSV